LKGPKYSKLVQDSIRAYKSVNPQAAREETIRAAGVGALISARLPIPPEILSQPDPLPTPPVSSFQPAAPAAGGPPPASPPSTNAFTLLNREFDDDDGIRR
jgi:hypothetical protein